jgi:hypothetical protein
MWTRYTHFCLVEYVGFKFWSRQLISVGIDLLAIFDMHRMFDLTAIGYSCRGKTYRSGASVYDSNHLQFVLRVLFLVDYITRNVIKVGKQVM